MLQATLIFYAMVLFAALVVVQEIPRSKAEEPMKIHILDANDRPDEGTIVQVNCGEKVAFHPVWVDWKDGRLCNECLAKHRSSSFKKQVFMIKS